MEINYDNFGDDRLAPLPFYSVDVTDEIFVWINNFKVQQQSPNDRVLVPLYPELDEKIAIEAMNKQDCNQTVIITRGNFKGVLGVKFFMDK